MNETLASQNKHLWRGETALALALIINTAGVLLMLRSGSGISAISSVPFAFSRVFPWLSLAPGPICFRGFWCAV